MKVPVALFLAFLVVVVLLTGFWETVSTTILPNTGWGLYSREFFSNLLASLHGNLVDFLLIGIILYWFERRHSAQQDASAKEMQREIAIERNTEALEDVAQYKGQDASFRTFAIVKRLIRLRGFPIACANATLSNLNIRGISLKGAKLHGVNFSNSRIQDVDLESAVLDAADFSGAILTNVKLKGASIRRAKFVGARANGMDFRGALLAYADFRETDLRSAIFAGVDCNGVNLDGADLTQANFMAATNLSEDAIKRIKNSKNSKHKF